jgi:benzoylformate decarboxylase
VSVFTYHVHTEGPFLADGTRLFHLDDDPAAAARAAVGVSVLTTVPAGLAELGRLVEPSSRAAPPPRNREPAPNPASAVLTAPRDRLPAGAVPVEEAPSQDELHERIPITTPRGYVSTGSEARRGAGRPGEPRRPVPARGGNGEPLPTALLWPAWRWSSAARCGSGEDRRRGTS